jgi:hypothetical protein
MPQQIVQLRIHILSERRGCYNRRTYTYALEPRSKSEIVGDLMNVIKVNEYWFKAVWESWLRAAYNAWYRYIVLWSLFIRTKNSNTNYYCLFHYWRTASCTMVICPCEIIATEEDH